MASLLQTKDPGESEFGGVQGQPMDAKGEGLQMYDYLRSMYETDPADPASAPARESQ